MAMSWNPKVSERTSAVLPSMVRHGVSLGSGLRLGHDAGRVGVRCTRLGRAVRCALRRLPRRAAPSPAGPSRGSRSSDPGTADHLPIDRPTGELIPGQPGDDAGHGNREIAGQASASSTGLAMRSPGTNTPRCAPRADAQAAVNDTVLGTDDGSDPRVTVAVSLAVPRV